MLTIHRTYLKSDNEKSLTYHIGDNGKSVVWTEKQFQKFLDSAPISVRVTGAHSADALTGILSSRGVSVYSGNWHGLGIEKGLEAGEIVARMSVLPDSLFRLVHFREDIARLRNLVDQRNALLQFYNSAAKRLFQIGRNMGIADPRESENGVMLEAFTELSELAGLFKHSTGRMRKKRVGEERAEEITISLETAVALEAKKIPECMLFNEIAGIGDSWMTAASIVSYCGDMERFPQVSSFWHYLGQHVIEGQAPKRRVGSPVTWSPKGKTVVYLMGMSLIKNRNNPWRAVYEEVLAEELASHGEKHPGCKYVQGHCGARARRKMCKEILKRYWVAMNGGQHADDTYDGSALTTIAV